jgi:hypothetical protein
MGLAPSLGETVPGDNRNISPHISFFKIARLTLTGQFQRPQLQGRKVRSALMSQVTVDIRHAVIGDDLVLDVGQHGILGTQTGECSHGNGFQD